MLSSEGIALMVPAVTVDRVRSVLVAHWNTCQVLRSKIELSPAVTRRRLRRVVVWWG